VKHYKYTFKELVGICYDKNIYVRILTITLLLEFSANDNNIQIKGDKREKI